MRALFELVLVIAAAFVARAILTSVLRGFFQASSQSSRRAEEFRRPDQAPANATGELHKDPVCGTYVASHVAWQRQAGGQTFYYCSDECRAKHALVAR